LEFKNSVLFKNICIASKVILYCGKVESKQFGHVFLQISIAFGRHCGNVHALIDVYIQSCDFSLALACG